MKKNGVTQHILDKVIWNNLKDINVNTTMVIYEGNKLCKLSDIFDCIGGLSFRDFYYETITYNGVELIGDVRYSRETNEIVIE